MGWGQIQDTANVEEQTQNTNRIQWKLRIRYRDGGIQRGEIWDTADTGDQRKDTAGAVDQVRNTRGNSTGYSGYWGPEKGYSGCCGPGT